MAKFSGHAAKTAEWVTNVGNEHSQVLMSVLTAKEGCGLAGMASGLINPDATAVRQPGLLQWPHWGHVQWLGGSADPFGYLAFYAPDIQRMLNRFSPTVQTIHGPLVLMYPPLGQG